MGKDKDTHYQPKTYHCRKCESLHEETNLGRVKLQNDVKIFCRNCGSEDFFLVPQEY